MPLDSVRDAFQRIEIVNIKQRQLLVGALARLETPSRHLRNVKSVKGKGKKRSDARFPC